MFISILYLHFLYTRYNCFEVIEMKKILFDDNWKFHKGDISEEIPSEKGWMYHQAKTVRNLWGAPSVEYNDEMWETVSLPHDYIIEQTPSSDGNQGLGYLKPENAW